MFRQIKYFQSVVKLNSFTEAAEENYISQSAISQQIQALENHLGVKLLVREKKKFSLTPAGDYFYRKSLGIIDELEKLCIETGKIARQGKAELHIGYLRDYSGNELQQAIAEFAAKYPDVEIRMSSGNHEELYDMIRFGQSDIVINDQRRAFSDEYRNLVLAENTLYAEISERNALSLRTGLEIDEVKDMTCILVVASPTQEENERSHYKDIVGIKSEILFAENIEQARMLVIGGKGYMPVECTCKSVSSNLTNRRIPLLRQGKEIHHNLCAFWKIENSGYYIEDFADILLSKFTLK